MKLHQYESLLPLGGNNHFIRCLTSRNDENEKAVHLTTSYETLYTDLLDAIIDGQLVFIFFIYAY